MSDTVSPVAAAAWSSYVDEVKAGQASVAFAVINACSTLKPQGRGRWRCSSPFRKERTPSFDFYADGHWYDHGPKEGGDLIAFLQKKDGTDFRTTIDTIAGMLGIPTWDERKKGLGGGVAFTDDQLQEIWNNDVEKRRVFEAITGIVHICHQFLNERLYSYLRSHYGLARWFIDAEKIGWVPGGLFETCQRELGHKYDDETLLLTGFFHVGKDDITPMMSDRILFPYWKDGVVVYTIGREYFGDIPKSEVHLEEWDIHAKYKKHRTYKAPTFSYVSGHITNDHLWGEDSLRGCRGDRVLITEGVTDAKMFKQLGYRVVSPVTTRYKTGDAARVVSLLKGASEVVIVNDADTLPDGTQPGLKGARAMALDLFAAGINVKIGRLPCPEGKLKTDVNELGRDHLHGGDGSIPDAEWRFAEARSFFDGVIAKAQTTLQFLVEEIPLNAQISDIETALQEIGALSSTLTPITQEDVFNKIFKRFPKLPKKLAKDMFLGASREAAREKKKEEKVAVEAQAPAVPAFTNKMRGMVEEDLGSYSKPVPSGTDERISTFSLTLKRVIVTVDDTPNRLACSILGINGKTLMDEWVIPASAWTGTKAFLGSFPSPEMNWTGTDAEIQGLKELLTKDGAVDKVPNTRVASVIGRYDLPEGPRFVLPSGTLSPEGWMAKPDVVYLPEGGSNLQHRLASAPTSLEDGRSVLIKAWPDMFAIQESHPLTVSYCWMFASLFQTKIRKLFRGFCTLNMPASAGAGKTSLVTGVLWPLTVGVEETEAMSCTSTLFSYTKDFASTNSLFLVLDEYRPDMGEKATDALHRLVRRLYAGESETRGKANQDVNVYYLRAGMMLLGEVRLDADVAMVERTVYVPLSKNWVKTHPEGREAFARLIRLPLALVGPFIQRWSLTVDVDAMLETARAETMVALGDHMPPERIKNNLMTIVFGMIVLRKLAADMGLVLPAHLPTMTQLVKGMLIDIYDQKDEETLPGFGGYVRDAVDSFLIEASGAARMGLLEHGVHYTHTGEGHVAIWLSGAIEVLDIRRRSAGRPPFHLNNKALCSVAREKIESGGSYIVTPNSPKVIDGHTARCLVFDPVKSDAWGIGDFPGKVEKASKIDYGAAAARAGFDYEKKSEPN